jgi:hypothetical protein
MLHALRRSTSPWTRGTSQNTSAGDGEGGDEAAEPPPSVIAALVAAIHISLDPAGQARTRPRVTVKGETRLQNHPPSVIAALVAAIHVSINSLDKLASDEVSGLESAHPA